MAPTRRKHVFGLTTLPSLAVLLAAPNLMAGPFIGQFELKTLEAEPGRFEFQSQNAWSWDQPRRRFAEDDEEGMLFDDNSVARQRYALELEMGLTHALKMRVGVEFEQERIDDPPSLAQANDFEDLTLGEIGIELIGVLSPREGDGTGFGVVAELEGPPDQDESNTLTLGPIVEWRSGRWFAAAVPMFVYAFGGDTEDGERVDDKWDFAYAAQLTYTFSPTWTLALEGYGTVERLGRTGHPDEAARVFGDFNQHRVGPVLYYQRSFGSGRDADDDDGLLSGSVGQEEPTTLTIGLGFLQGLNSHTPDQTLKLSIEVDF